MFSVKHSAQKPPSASWVTSKTSSFIQVHNTAQLRTLRNSRPRMARHAGCARFVRFMATHTARHAGDAGALCHYIHLSHLAVTHHALHPGRQMLTVRPGHARSYLIDALPRDRLAASRELG